MAGASDEDCDENMSKSRRISRPRWSIDSLPEPISFWSKWLATFFKFYCCCHCQKKKQKQKWKKWRRKQLKRNGKKAPCLRLSFPHWPLINFPRSLPAKKLENEKMANGERRNGRKKRGKEEAETETKALGGHFKNYASPFANKPLNRCSTTAAISVLRQQHLLRFLVLAAVCVLVPNECISSLNSISCNLHNAAQQKGLTLPSKRSCRESTVVESAFTQKPENETTSQWASSLLDQKPDTDTRNIYLRVVCDCRLIRIDKQTDIR